MLNSSFRLLRSVSIFKKKSSLRLFSLSNSYLSSSDVKSQSENKETLINLETDKFGSLSKSSLNDDFLPEDPEDEEENIRLKNMDRRGRNYYSQLVKNYLDNHQFKEAMNLLQERMLKVDRVKPDSYIYDMLISYCGKIGDVKTAFKLYNEIKKRRYHVTGGQYTSLFNACANSLNSVYALEVARKVRKYFAEDTVHRRNMTNYNAMMKAFGRHGDLKTTLEIIDELIQKRSRVLSESYSFLLQACASDRNSGFRHALLVWHKCLVNKTNPDIYAFNSILRTVRDCSVGNTEEFKCVISKILQEKELRSYRKILLPSSSSALSKLIPLDESDRGISNIKTDVKTIITSEIRSNLPNLLDLRPNMGSVTNITTFDLPYHRLQLLGGVTGFLNAMASANVQPNIKTFTMLLEIIPADNNFEHNLISIAKLINVNLDIGFFNVLIKRRSFRYDDDGARDVLSSIQLNGLTPDLITFGVLALSCRTKEQAKELISDIRNAGFRLNSEIVGPLMRHAVQSRDVTFVQMLVDAMKEDSVKPSPKVVVSLKNFMKRNKDLLLNVNSINR